MEFEIYLGSARRRENEWLCFGIYLRPILLPRSDKQRRTAYLAFFD